MEAWVRMVEQMTKICDWKASVAFLPNACTCTDGNKQTDICVCVCRHVYLSSKSRCWYAFKWKVWYVYIHAAQAFALDTDKPLFFCQGIKLKNTGVYVLGARNNLEVFTKISYRTSWTSRNIMREESCLSCFMLDSNWAPQQLWLYYMLGFIIGLVSKHLTKYTSFLTIILTEIWEVN